MCIPAMAGSENLRIDRAQIENRSSEEVMSVGRNLVTPVALSASVACFNWSGMQPGVLKSTPAKHCLTACALRASGTTQIISLDLRICRTDIDSAFSGTSDKVENHPSFTCCQRQASSRATIKYEASASKSAGASLNAR